MRLVHSFSPFEEFCFLFDDDGLPAEVSVWRESDLQTGALYVAQAVRCVGSGWFLDVGKEAAVYLNNPPFYLKPDGTLCDRKLIEGDRLIVRIVRPQTAEKEAEASYKATLSGQYTVLIPTQKTPSFSRQLAQEAKDRLKLLAPDDGVLFRTASQNADLNEIASEIERLKQEWKSVLPKNDKPGLLYKPRRDIFAYAEKYRDSLTEIVTDDSETSAFLKKEGFNVIFDMQGVWEKERLDEALDMVRAERTPLPSGGFLIVQQTAACVCFDVNTGSGHAFAANEEACPEILRQIRLKGLGGQMIVDFAGRKDKKVISHLLPKLKNENVFVGGISTLGLVELTVEKTKRSIFDLFSFEQKDIRNAAEIIRALWFSSPKTEVLVCVPAGVLKYLSSCVRRLEDRLGTNIKLQTSETIRTEGIANEKA